MKKQKVVAAEGWLAWQIEKFVCTKELLEPENKEKKQDKSSRQKGQEQKKINKARSNTVGKLDH